MHYFRPSSVAYLEIRLKIGWLLDVYSGMTVTSVRPVPGLSDNFDEYGWLVQGYANETGKPFDYRCKRVVLATGTTDSPNRLGLPGEESQPSWITHDLNDFENKLDRLANEHGNFNFSCIINFEKLYFSIKKMLIFGTGSDVTQKILK